MDNHSNSPVLPGGDASCEPFCRTTSGIAGSWDFYFEVAQSRDDRVVQPDRERKSSGSETIFPEDLTDPARIEAGEIFSIWE
jgi:DNA polymerase-4